MAGISYIDCRQVPCGPCGIETCSQMIACFDPDDDDVFNGDIEVEVSGVTTISCAGGGCSAVNTTHIFTDPPFVHASPCNISDSVNFGICNVQGMTLSWVIEINEGASTARIEVTIAKGGVGEAIYALYDEDALAAMSLLCGGGEIDVPFFSLGPIGSPSCGSYSTATVLLRTIPT